MSQRVGKGPARGPVSRSVARWCSRRVRARWWVLSLIAGGLGLSSPSQAAARAVSLRLTGPRADDAARGLTSALGALGIGVAAPVATKSNGKGGVAEVRGTIAQLRGFWALRLAIVDSAGGVLVRRSFPLRGARVDPGTLRDAARAVASVVRRGERKAPNRHRPARRDVKPAGVAAIRFERRGSAIVVPARITGPAGSIQVKMVFDTGATFTTLSRATLQRLGVPDGGATMQFSTANGVVRRRIAVVHGIAIGDAAVDRLLTVSECDTCAGGGVEGLLGLNFSRHFVTSVDHDEGRLVLQPKRVADPDTFDASPFIRLVGVRSTQRGDELQATFVLRNDSPVALQDVVLSTRTKSAPKTTIDLIAPGAERQAQLSIPLRQALRVAPRLS